MRRGGSPVAWINRSTSVSSEIAGLHVPPGCREGVRRYLFDLEASKTGGYILLGRGTGKNGTRVHHRVAAAGAAFANQVEYDDRFKGAAARFIRDGGFPRWTDNEKSVDLYYWYFGSLAFGSFDDEDRDVWKDALRRALIDRQEADGSWAPVGAFSDGWGRVGQTAMAVQCMQLVE